MIMSDRDVFLGCHVTAPVKSCIQKEATRRGMTVSALVFRMLSKSLKELGHPVEYTEVGKAI